MSVVDNRQFRSHGRFFVDATRTRVVPEGSPESAFLLISTGQLLPLETAVAYGIADKDGNPLDPFAEETEVEEEPVVETKSHQVITTLTDIQGLGPATEKALKDAGYDTPAKLAAAEVEEIAELGISGVNAGKVEDFQRQIAQSREEQQDGSDADAN